MPKNTIFEALGYSVVSQENGVYHLQYTDTDGNSQANVVALLFASAQLSADNRQVKLFAQEVPAETPPARIVYHWQMLDARRLEESGLMPLELELSADQVSGPLPALTHTRPNGVSIRHVVKLTTGEIVCYN